MSTFSFQKESQYGHVDERASNRRRLIAEDAAKRPWLIGKALRDFRYTWWSRIKLVFRETLDAARWSWRMSKWDRVVYIFLLLVAIILAWAWFSTGPAPVDCIPAEEECSSLGDSSP